MRTGHIVEILDQTNFAALGSEDLQIISKHIADCENCRQAFRAARITAALLKKAASETSPAPNVFFQAKVLDAWRERQNPPSPKIAFRRWWQASGALVFTMLLIVIGLISFSAVAPIPDSAQIRNEVPNYNLYSTDSIILNRRMPKNLTTEQAFEVLDASAVSPKK